MTQPIFKTVKISGVPYYCRWWKSDWYNKGRNDPLSITKRYNTDKLGAQLTKAPLMLMPGEYTA
jgi:hypothetical protein